MAGVRAEDGENRGQTSAGKRRAGPVSEVTIVVLRTAELRTGCGDPGPGPSSRLCLACGVSFLSPAPSGCLCSLLGHPEHGTPGCVQGRLHTSQGETLRIPLNNAAYPVYPLCHTVPSLWEETLVWLAVLRRPLMPSPGIHSLCKPFPLNNCCYQQDAVMLRVFL